MMNPPRSPLPLPLWLWVPLNMLGSVLALGLAFLALLGLGILLDALQRLLDFPVWLRYAGFFFFLVVVPVIVLVMRLTLGGLQQWYLGRQRLRPRYWGWSTAVGMTIDLCLAVWLGRRGILAPFGLSLALVQGMKLPGRVRLRLLWGIVSVLGLTVTATVGWRFSWIAQIGHGGIHVHYIGLAIWMLVTGISTGLYGLLTLFVLRSVLRSHPR